MTKITKRNKLITLCASATILCLLEANQVKADEVNIITPDTNKDTYIDNAKDKHKKILETQEQLKQVVGEISEVSEKLVKVSEQCDKYQEKIDQSKKKKENAIQQLASLEKQESEAKNLLDPVNNDYLAAKEEYQKLCDEKEKASDKLANHKENIKETKSKLEKKEAQLKDIEAELQKLEDKLQNFFDTKLKNSGSAEHILWKLENAYPKQKEDHTNSYQRAKKEYEKAKEEYDRVKDDPNVDKQTKSNLLSDINFNKEEMREEQDTLDGIDQSIAADQQTLINLKNAYLNDPVVKSIKEQENKLTEDKTNYQKEVQLLQDDLSKSNSNAIDDKYFEQINSDITAAQTKIDTLAQKLSEQKQNLSQIEKQIADHKAKTTAEENEATAMSQSLAKLLVEKEAKAKFLNELQQKKAQLEDLLEVLERYHAVFPEEQDKSEQLEQSNETENKSDQASNQDKETVSKPDKTPDQGKETVNKPDKTPDQGKETVNKPEQTPDQGKGTVTKLDKAPNQDKEITNKTDKVNENKATDNKKNDPTVKKDKDDVKNDKNWILIFHKEVPKNTEKTKAVTSKEKTKNAPKKETIKVSQVKFEKGHLFVKINQSWHKISSTKVNKLFKKNYKFKATGKIKKKTNFYNQNGKKLKKVAKAGKKIKISQIKMINQKLMVKLSAQNKWLPLTKVSFK